MDAFIYCADIYCADCGKAIRKRLDDANTYNAKDYERDFGEKYNPPNASTPQNEYDSDEYPKGPFSDGGGESDSPQHCGSGPDCVNAIEFPDGIKVGCWLENPLTDDGVQYVREALQEGGEVAALWGDWYAEELSNG